MTAATAPTVTAVALQEAIIATLRAHFGERVQTVDAYWPLGPLDETPQAELQTPALLLRVERQELEQGYDPENRMRVRVSFALYCILSIGTPRLYLELPELSADVLRVLSPRLNISWRGQTWGLDRAVDAPEAVTDDEGEFIPGPAGSDSRIVRWDQVVAYPDRLPGTT